MSDNQILYTGTIFEILINGNYNVKLDTFSHKHHHNSEYQKKLLRILF